MTALPNPFLNSTVSPRAVGSAVASNPTPAADATAAPNSALASAMTADTAAAPDLTDHPVAASVLIAEPTSSTGGRQETPASAPTENPDVGVLADIDCINEIFFYARKLMKQPPRFVLDADAFMAEVEEVPLFIREDGYLKRQA